MPHLIKTVAVISVKKGLEGEHYQLMRGMVGASRAERVFSTTCGGRVLILKRSFAFSKFVGLDDHKATIAVSVAEANGGVVRYVGKITNTPDAIEKLVRQLRK